MSHRAGAGVAGAAIIAVSLRQWRLARGTPWLGWLSLVPIALLAVQVSLGLASVLSLLDLTIITTHLAVGAALLGSLVVLFELSPRTHPSAAATARTRSARSSDAVAIP
jgi:heme A synthase